MEGLKRVWRFKRLGCSHRNVWGCTSLRKHFRSIWGHRKNRKNSRRVWSTGVWVEFPRVWRVQLTCKRGLQGFVLLRSYRRICFLSLSGFWRLPPHSSACVTSCIFQVSNRMGLCFITSPLTLLPPFHLQGPLRLYWLYLDNQANFLSQNLSLNHF